MRIRELLAAVAGAALLAGCSIPGADKHSWNTGVDYGTPGAVVATHASVAYYPACGNEILNYDGRSWYPYKPMYPADLPSDPLTSAADAAGFAPNLAGATGLVPGAAPVGAVAAPGPGDDVGTLVIYDNDLAYWESDSGTLKRWLTSHEIEYNWVC